jgi:hypothetical protein
MALAAFLAFGLRLVPLVGLSQCSCGEPGAFVVVPPQRAASVTDLRASGPACSGGRVECYKSSPEGCVYFYVEARAEGACRIEIDFADAETFVKDLRIVETEGCMCSGLYPEPFSEYEIRVDAGG